MTEVLKSYETFISTSTQKSLIKMNSTKSLQFLPILPFPKAYAYTKRLNDKSHKLLRNIYFYFYTM